MGRPTTRRRGKEQAMDPQLSPTREDMESSQSQTTMPMPPSKFWWHQSNFGKTTKLATRLKMEDTLKLLEDKKVDPAVKNWFYEHPQFKHLWHLKTRKNMLTGMWLLLVRIVETKKKEKEAWFVVNGVPIRYSMREHALITGFDCRKYPEGYEKLGSLEMVKRVFGRDNNILHNDILEKFKDMTEKWDMTGEEDGDYLHVAVLLLLASVISGKKRDNFVVDEFTLRMAGDLEACKSFPWGRVTFEHNVNYLYYTAEKHKGRVPRYWGFPGFCLPLQLLPFEAIPSLASRFQDVIPGAKKDCPRMCKTAFKPHAVRSGFSLPCLYEALGETTDIHTILEPSRLEQSFLLRIMPPNKHGEEDVDDPVVDSWVRWVKKHRELCWRELLDLDVAGRKPIAPEDDPASQEQAQSSQPSVRSLYELMENGFKKINERIDNGFKEINERIDLIESRVKAVESMKDNIYMNVDPSADTADHPNPTADPPNPTADPTADPPTHTADPPNPTDDPTAVPPTHSANPPSHSQDSPSPSGVPPTPTASPCTHTSASPSHPADRPKPAAPTSTASAASATNPGLTKRKQKSHKKCDVTKKRRIKLSKYFDSPYG